jgi:hypothetical protein
MSRRFLLYSLLITCGLLGWWGLGRSRPTTTPEAKAHVPRRSSPVRQSMPPVTKLDFLTDLGQPYQVRIQSLRTALETECGEPEIRYLYQLLEKGPAAAEIPEQGYMVANEMMSQLIRYETDRSRFASNFTALLNDSKQPPVLRDYAVQFLGSLIDPRKSTTSANTSAPPLTPETIAQVMKELVSVATDPALNQTSVPGTTLMVLVNLAGGGLDCRSSIATLKPWIGQALAEGSSLDLACRVSAVVAAGALAPEDFRPTLRKIAYQPDGSGALQLSALASLGQAGDAADLPNLRHVAATQPTLAYAASDACRVLTARLAGDAPKISQ